MPRRIRSATRVRAFRFDYRPVLGHSLREMANVEWRIAKKCYNVNMRLSETGVSHATKYCLGCSYVLDGLPEDRCPECARPFDPQDPRTFRRTCSPHAGRWKVFFEPTRFGMIACIVLPAIIALLISLILPLLQRLR